MEKTIKNGIAESGLAEFLSYIEQLLKEALDPYKDQIKGKWQAEGIRQSVVRSYERAWTLSQFFFGQRKEGKTNPYDKDKKVRSVSYHLCQEIDQQIMRYFQEHGEGLIWVPDFNAYGEVVDRKLEEILQEASSFENKNIRNNRENIISL